MGCQVLPVSRHQACWEVRPLGWCRSSWPPTGDGPHPRSIRRVGCQQERRSDPTSPWSGPCGGTLITELRQHHPLLRLIHGSLRRGLRLQRALTCPTAPPCHEGHQSLVLPFTRHPMRLTSDSSPYPVMMPRPLLWVVQGTAHHRGRSAIESSPRRATRCRRCRTARTFRCLRGRRTGRPAGTRGSAHARQRDDDRPPRTRWCWSGSGRGSACDDWRPDLGRLNQPPTTTEARLHAGLFRFLRSVSAHVAVCTSAPTSSSTNPTTGTTTAPSLSTESPCCSSS